LGTTAEIFWKIASFLCGPVNPPGRAAGGFYQQATSPAKAEEVGSAVLEVDEHSDRLIID